MRDAEDFATVCAAPNAPIAELLASMLRDAGIPACVPGGALQDEWASSQRLMGLLSCDVKVPRGWLEEARKFLEEAKVDLEESPEGIREERAQPEKGEPTAPAGAPAYLDGHAPTGAVRAETEAALPSEAPPKPLRSRRAMALELGAAAIAWMLPWLLVRFGGFLSDGYPWSLASHTVQDALLGTIQYALQSAILLCIISRAGDGWAGFGLRRPEWTFDFPIAAFLLLLQAGAGVFLADAFFGSRAVSPLRGFPEGPRELLAVAIFAGFAGFAEELMFRGYLITRLEALLDSRGIALVLSAALYAGFYAHRGAAAAVVAGFMGLAFGAFFVLSRRLSPVALAHALGNMILFTQVQAG